MAEQVINPDALAKQEVAIQSQIEALDKIINAIGTIDELSEKSPRVAELAK